MLRQGAKIKSTQLGGEYDYQTYIGERSRYLLPLFAVDQHGQLHIFTAEQIIVPESGWLIISLTVDT